ncbi:MAG: FkbM family methyltransferase [Alphaproteobacteria bacterium]|nr:FkbM family methyltransferase [Alphaproteobacteria bacterium]
MFIRHKIMKVLRLFLSFGWGGEDKIFQEMIEAGIMPKKGTYLDIGAHHPIKCSNTLLLYLRGWSGTNIDILNKWKFKLFRHRDVYVHGYIEADTFYLFPKELSTSSHEIASDRIKRGWEHTIRKVPQHSITDFTGYDLLSLDVDGIEVKILKKLMDHYKPPFICCENMLPEQREVDRILFDNGYKKLAQTFNNGIFRRS